LEALHHAANVAFPVLLGSTHFLDRRTIALPETISGAVSGTGLVRAVLGDGSAGTDAEDVHEEALGVVLVFDFLCLPRIGFAVALALVFKHLGRLL
jgi:hypothetical protein